jgi:hypothetical protein
MNLPPFKSTWIIYTHKTVSDHNVCKHQRRQYSVNSILTVLKDKQIMPFQSYNSAFFK